MRKVVRKPSSMDKSAFSYRLFQFVKDMRPIDVEPSVQLTYQKAVDHIFKTQMPNSARVLSFEDALERAKK